MSQCVASLNAALLLAFLFSLGVNLGMYGSFHHMDLASPLHALARLSLRGAGNQPSAREPLPIYNREAVAAGLPPEQLDRNSVRGNHGGAAHAKAAVLPVNALVRPPVSSASASPSASLGPIASYLASGRQLPIVLVTCDRPAYLSATLASLRAVRGVRMDRLLVSQDGDAAAVTDVARASGARLAQNAGPSRRFLSDGAERIATHYKFTLTTAFATFPSAPAVIVAEDDLLFAPDFYEFFAANAALLDSDPSLLALSAWNDNGFKGRVGAPLDLLRTTFFPGLGWLLSRKLYKDELEAQWPSTHWDHWLRSPAVSRDREVLYPSMPRSFHNGVTGTFMDEATHNRYFRDIAYNKDASVVWSSDGLQSARKDAYEERLVQAVRSCAHVASLDELDSAENSMRSS